MEQLSYGQAVHAVEKVEDHFSLAQIAAYNKLKFPCWNKIDRKFVLITLPNDWENQRV